MALLPRRPNGFTMVFQKERDVRRWVTNLKEHAILAVDDALTDVAMSIETQAIKNLSKGFKGPDGRDGGALDTGRLMAGFRGIDDEKLHKVVGNNVSYAAHMEYGTGPGAGMPRYRPPDGALSGWAGRIGKDEDEVGQIIWKRGTLPRRFLGRAFHEKKKTIPKRVAKHLTRLKEG